MAESRPKSGRAKAEPGPAQSATVARSALQQLHCQHLQQMELCTCSVQLGAAADGTLGLLHRCTNLTSLIINSHIFDTPAGAVVDSLSSLVHLQHLRLRPVAGRWTVTVRPDDQPVGGLSHATLPSLQRLTLLDVNALSMENLLQLGALTCLQELRLWTAGDVVVGPGSVPGLVFPASLKTLVLSSPVEAGILSLVPAKLQALRIRNRLEGPVEGPVSLLSCMARLQHLTELSVQPSNHVNWPDPGCAYSALTASTQLVNLDICITKGPHGMWPYVFPSARVLPQLNSVILMHSADDEPDVAMLSPRMGAADLSSLVNCCPNLHDIANLPMQSGLHVSELRKLTALENLSLSYDFEAADSCDESVRGLATLTQLHHLDVGLESQQNSVWVFCCR